MWTEVCWARTLSLIPVLSVIFVTVLPAILGTEVYGGNGSAYTIHAHLVGFSVNHLTALYTIGLDGPSRTHS